MKIAEVRVHVLEAALSEPFFWAINEARVRGSAVVEIVTDTGLSGFGECFGPARPCAAMVEAYTPLLLGADPLATDLIWETLYDRFRDQGQKGVPLSALSGVDIGLWDLKGKHFGVPVYRLMGGPLRTQVDADATGTYRKETGDPFDYIIEEVKGYAAEGFKGVKLKIGFDVAEDAALIAAVRAAIGPDLPLMLDANHGYDSIEAIKLGRRVEQHDITWFEEPVPPENADEMARVARSTSVPIATGERLATKYEFARVLDRQAASILQPALGRVGGILEAKKIAGMAEAHHAQIAPHLYCGPIEGAANIQIATCSPNFLILESIQTWGGFHAKILKKPIRWQDGHVIPPTAPGLGVELDEDVAAAHPYEGEALHLEMRGEPG